MVVAGEWFKAQTELTHQLEIRPGVPARIRRSLPHLQLDQLPPAEIAAELIERSLDLPFIRSRQGRMATPRSLALWLPDACAGGPPDAFIDSHEFCHLHPLPDFGIHLTLPDEPRRLAVELGWAEQHPAAQLGCMPRTLVLVYAPRDVAELHPVLRLVRRSYEFARGL